MKFQRNINLSRQTSFKIGGPAKFFCVCENKKDLIAAVKKAKQERAPFFILGAGTNVLALDKGYKGLVIKIQNSEIKIQGSEISAEAGVLLGKVAGKAGEASLSGLEWAIGLPGTVGGAVYGNSQAFGNKMSDNIKQAEVLDINDMKIKIFPKNKCGFSGKASIFKKNKNLIILSVILKLSKGIKKDIFGQMKKNIKIRKETQPLNYPSAGSIFINQAGSAPSSFLIDKAGLKGKKQGGAEISQKHAGFIINAGKAKSEDVLKLIKIAKKKVKEKFGVELKEEIQIIK